MSNRIIRNETPADYRAVEELTREAFWNVYKEGADEHYYLTLLRKDPAFVPELDLLLEENGVLIAHVAYTESTLTDEDGNAKTILSFGPLSVHPDYQRKGYGKQLLEASFEIAAEMGYEAVVIFGNPENYVPRGFLSCRKSRVHMPDGLYPTALLVKELKPGALSGKSWTYTENIKVHWEPEDVDGFDRTFPEKKKEWRPTQEMFYIYSHSQVVFD